MYICKHIYAYIIQYIYIYTHTLYYDIIWYVRQLNKSCNTIGYTMT